MFESRMQDSSADARKTRLSEAVCFPYRAENPDIHLVYHIGTPY